MKAFNPYLNFDGNTREAMTFYNACVDGELVIQTFGDTWTSQLFILADFHNIAAADPKWADNYTNNKAKYVDQPALSSFQRLEAVSKAGHLNKDFASIKNTQGRYNLFLSYFRSNIF